MKNKDNIMKITDDNLFNMVTTTWDIGNTIHKHTNYNGTTTKWKRDDVLDKIFVQLAKKN